MLRRRHFFPDPVAVEEATREQPVRVAVQVELVVQSAEDAYDDGQSVVVAQSVTVFPEQELVEELIEEVVVAVESVVLFYRHHHRRRHLHLLCHHRLLLHLLLLSVDS